LSYKVIADYKPWSGFYHEGQIIPNGNFTPTQLEQIKKRGYTIVDSNEPPPAHLDLIQNSSPHLSPEQVNEEWEERDRQMKSPDPMATLPPSPASSKSPLAPEAVKAAAIAGK
jgi:hypothetical protein